MIGSQRQLYTTETTNTHILSLKPHTTNIKKLNDTRIWFRRKLSCINIIVVYCKKTKMHWN